MYQCPIQYFTDNLIFNIDRSCWAAFKLQGYDYDFLDEDLKISMLYKTARFLSGILSEAQILIVPVEQDTKEHFKNLIHNLDPEDILYEQAKFHAETTEEYLAQRKEIEGNSNDYRTYIIVKLEEQTESELVTSLKSGCNFFLKNPANAVNVFMALDTKDILLSKVRDCMKMADQWYESQGQRMKLKKLQGRETQWLFRRMAYRGINKKIPLFEADTISQKEWKPKATTEKAGTESVLRPYTKDVINLFSGTIHPGKRMLRVEHDKETVSYQAFLSLTNIPDELDYPGMEWIYMLQQYNLQAEVCIHIQAMEYRTAQKKLDGKKREIDSQVEHILDAAAKVPENLQMGQIYAETLEAELKDMREPLLYTGITICIASDDEEELERRVTFVKNEYQDMNFVVERPLADQISLFMQCIPSVGCMVKDFIMPLTPMGLASGVIGATHELGDKKGPYIGITGQESKYVYLYMGLACLMNKSASATFFGNLGMGKSFNANLLVILNILYGGYGLIFDPKAERSHWETELTVLKGLITTVTLSSDPENKGKLDPYNLYRDDLKAADELAINILAELLKIAPTSVEYTAILEAQRMMQEKHSIQGADCIPSMLTMIEVLGAFPPEDELCQNARYLARRLKLQANTGMSQLLFGDGTEQAVSLDNRLNILQIDNLKLPSPETPKENYTAEENLSTVLMAVLSNFAKKFAMVKRPVFKLVLFDESWALGKTVEGVKLYDFLTRMGRSLFTGCIFNGHSVLDLPTEGIKNTISYKFCFQTQNDAEAHRMCEYMGVEPTPGNKETIKELQNGECLFQDLDGHVGILKFDAVFQDLIDVFSTTPKEKETDKKEKPAKKVVQEAPLRDISDAAEEKSKAEAIMKDGVLSKSVTDQKIIEAPEETDTVTVSAVLPDLRQPAQANEEAFLQEEYDLDFTFDEEDLFRREETS